MEGMDKYQQSQLNRYKYENEINSVLIKLERAIQMIGTEDSKAKARIEQDYGQIKEKIEQIVFEDAEKDESQEGKEISDEEYFDRMKK